MKANRFLSTLAAAFALAGALTISADPVRYEGRPGSKLKLEGTSTVHDWTVESGIISGFIEFQSEVALDPATLTGEVKVTPKVEVAIPVSSLQSGKKLMDEIMHDTLKIKDNPKIAYALKEMTAKPHKVGEPFQFDTKGDLTVAGVTKPIDMVVTLTPMAAGKLKASGSKEVKMSDFGMKAPAPAIGLGLIKTADEVKVTFEWMTMKKERKTASLN